MSEERHSVAVPSIVAILLLLPFVYVGAYFALVSRDQSIIWIDGEYLPSYRVGDSVARFFWPAHLADRCLRAEYWSAPPAVQVDLSEFGVETELDSHVEQ